VVGNLLTAASGATASLRGDGSVVFAGGSALKALSYCPLYPFRRCPPHGYAPVSETFAELFAPESEGFTVTGSLVTPRDGHTATVLADGTVLVAGGVKHFIGYVGGYSRSESVTLSSAELYK
jgi:hypothetical protein